MITEKVREVLIQAFLDNVPQIQHAARTSKGFCSVGVLYEYLVKQGLCTWEESKQHGYYLKDAKGMYLLDTRLLQTQYGLTTNEIWEISYMNDSPDKPTFLDIARKIGLKEEVITNGPRETTPRTGS